VELAHRSPLVECFRQGDVPRDVRLLAARGGLTPQVNDQLQLLVILASDPDLVIAGEARHTILRLPATALEAVSADTELPDGVRGFYADVETSLATLAARDQAGGERLASAAPAGEPAADPAAEVIAMPESPAVAGPMAEPVAEPSVEASPELVPESGEPPIADEAAAIEADPERRGAAQKLSMLSVAERVKVAMQGSREERSILVRDPNRLVSSAVLSSPKLTESEVETIARMTNVADEVLRVVGTNRTWTKNYPVIAALTRNPKTPVGVSLTLLPRLVERDLRMLSTDRNVPEPIRLSARKLYSRGAARRQ
jgi:hypothetical protein